MGGVSFQMPFFSLWGKEPEPPSAQDKLKEAKKATRKQTRQISREIKHAEMEEKKIMRDMKKHAANGRTDCAKVLAKQLVRTRQQQTKMYQTNAQINGMAMQADSMKNTLAMTNALKSGVDVMQTVNSTMDPAAMQALGADFLVEQQKAEITTEMFDDLFDDLMEGEEEEANEEIDKIMDELAMGQMEGAKGTQGLVGPSQIAQPAQVQEQQQGPMLADGGNDEDDDLAARLAALRR